MAGGGGGGGGERQLDQTPTWAVAAVCAVIILISIVLEKFLHRLGEVLINVLFAWLQFVLLLYIYVV